ncbi:MAG: hypothetical protein WC068_01220 [Caulobacter sp.]
MKLHLFVTAAIAAAAVSAPAFAAEPVGSVGLSAAHTNIDIGPIDAEGDSYGLDGSVALPTASNWTVTLGAAVVSTDDDLNDDTVASGNLALTYAGSDWRAGGFVGAGETGGETLWAVGGVAQKHLGDVTLVGTAGYGKVDGIDADLWGARGDVRYFVSDNFRINGGVGVARIDGSGGDADLWTIGAGGEYQFAGTNWSVFGGYDRTEANDLDLTADTVKIGVRFGFGGDLRARDRSGADLAGAQALFGGLQ